LTKEEVINIYGKLNLTVDKINKIIKNLKIYVRDGNLDPYVPVQVDTIVLDVLDLCKPKVVSHGIELLMPTAKIESTINCRSTQIYQVLVNLINNSCDAIENLKEKWIQVEVADEKNDVVFKITDSGNGIDKAIRDKIFQTFFTTKEVGKGTGLGLSISSKIILDHGGTMVINGEHKNTQFIIKLPKSVSKE
jgi:C4-dicarboxylate-specific signal transduction histidine kinase